MNANRARAERGMKAIKLHPDYTATDVTTPATDIIADILHGLEAMGSIDDLVAGGTAAEILDRALRTYEGDAEDEQDDQGLTWASTGNLNSRDHIARVEPFQNKALCGAGIAGMTETRPVTPNLCPKCAREARALGVDPARLGIENGLVGERSASPFSEVGPHGEDHS